MSGFEDFLKYAGDPIPSFRFILRIEGAFDMPLRSIKPFTKENEYEYIEEGGMNDYVHTIRKHCTKPHTLQIERYLSSSFYDPVPNGTEFMLPLLLFVGQNDNGDFSWAPMRTYAFFGCMVLNKEVGGFDAEKSGLLTETVTIAYHQTMAIETPEGLLYDNEPWKFTEGNITNKYANQGEFALIKNQGTTKDFDLRAQEHLWKFGENAEEYLGNGIRSAEASEQNIKQNKVTKATMNTRASHNLWKFGKTKDEFLGNGQISPKAAVTEEYAARPVRNEQTGVEFAKTTARELYEKRAAAHLWKFGANADEWQGNKQQSATKLPKEASKAEQKIADANMDEKSTFVQRADEHLWKFGADNKAYLGNGKTSAAHNKDELRKDQMEKKAHLWPKQSSANQMPEKEDAKQAAPEENLWKFGRTKDEFMGNGKTSAKHNEKELSKAQMEALAKANLWPAKSNAMKYPNANTSKEEFLKG